MSHAPSSDQDRNDRSVGLAQAIGAYLWWGFGTGLYFKLLDEVAPLELLAWRVLSGLPVMLVLMALPPGFRRLRPALSDGRSIRLLVASTTLISINWFVFIYAVVSGRLVEASLGYFINPLVSVLLGRIFLGERLRPMQLAAIGVAILGVVVFAWSTLDDVMSDSGTSGAAFGNASRLPWIALALPLSFGCYGLLRKQMSADSITGLTVEMGLLLPIMLGLELWLAMNGGVSFLHAGLRTDALLLAGGVVTAVPLVLFAAAARRLRLTTIGLLQYIAPTCQFILAVVVFGESVDPTKVGAFCLIWLAVTIYSLDSWRSRHETGIGSDPSD